MNRASNTGLMTIRLTRDNRFPFAGVEVQLTDGNKIYNTITDQNGRASFNVGNAALLHLTDRQPGRTAVHTGDPAHQFAGLRFRYAWST